MLNLDAFRKLAEIAVENRENLSDEQALIIPQLYADWKADRYYEKGKRYLYNGILYKVIQAHQGQADWAPDVAVSLFAPVLNPDPEVIPDWVQPESTNGYMIGDKVRYHGAIYISLINNNVWAPDVYPQGWRLI